MKIIHKAVLMILGFGFGVGTAILKIYEFLLAYMNPNKMTCININQYGEANFELIFISVFFIIFLIVVIFAFKKLEA